MVLAVTYDNATGEIWQHFGHSEHFKLYEIENGEIIDEAVIQPFGAGHDNVVYTLQEYAVTLAFCGGIGPGAVNGLQNAGIQVVPGLSGNADETVKAFLRGEIAIPMTYAGNCDHHDHGDGGCCDSSSCGSGCGGCCHQL